jgi:two-component system sensor histidine kinase AlgZ
VQAATVQRLAIRRLLSLALVCLVRKNTNAASHSSQWAVAIGLPVLLTLLVSLVVLQILEIPLSVPEIFWLMLSRALIAATAAWAVVEYFRLRARAYSPSFAEARLQALQARIRPHFLFNSLNTVLGLMRGDPRRAEATLENLADLFRVAQVLKGLDEVGLLALVNYGDDAGVGQRQLRLLDEDGADATLERDAVDTVLLQLLLRLLVHLIDQPVQRLLDEAGQLGLGFGNVHLGRHWTNIVQVVGPSKIALHEDCFGSDIWPAG